MPPLRRIVRRSGPIGLFKVAQTTVVWFGEVSHPNNQIILILDSSSQALLCVQVLPQVFCLEAPACSPSQTAILPRSFEGVVKGTVNER